MPCFSFGSRPDPNVTQIQIQPSFFKFRSSSHYIQTCFKFCFKVKLISDTTRFSRPQIQQEASSHEQIRWPSSLFDLAFFSDYRLPSPNSLATALSRSLTDPLLCASKLINTNLLLFVDIASKTAIVTSVNFVNALAGTPLHHRQYQLRFLFRPIYNLHEACLPLDGDASCPIDDRLFTQITGASSPPTRSRSNGYRLKTSCYWVWEYLETSFLPSLRISQNLLYCRPFKIPLLFLSSALSSITRHIFFSSLWTFLLLLFCHRYHGLLFHRWNSHFFFLQCPPRFAQETLIALSPLCYMWKRLIGSKSSYYARRRLTCLGVLSSI